jgi:hypothetical protein
VILPGNDTALAVTNPFAGAPGDVQTTATQVGGGVENVPPTAQVAVAVPVRVYPLLQE